MTVETTLALPANRRKLLRRNNNGYLSWQDVPRIFVDDYGALGDGSTNDTAAIDLAMDDAYALATTINKKVILEFNGDKTYVIARRVSGVSGLGGIFVRRGVCLEGNGATLQLSTVATTTCAFIKTKEPTTSDKIATATTSTAITGDVAINATQITVTSSAGFAVGDDVFLRINDNAYDAVETKDPMFAKILTVDDATHVTLDRPIPVAMTVASTATANKKLIVLHEPIEGIFIRNFVLINSEIGTANAEYGIDIRYTRNCVVENIIAEHPGPGIVNGGYNEGLIGRNLRVRKCDKQAAHVAKGRVLGLWNAKNCQFLNIYGENFQGPATYFESYCRNVSVKGMHVVNNHPSHSTTDIFTATQLSEVHYEDVLVEGAGGCPVFGAGGTSGLNTYRNLVLNTATQVTGGVPLYVGDGALRIGSAVYTDIIRRTVPFRLIPNMVGVTLTMPTGLYRRFKVYVSSTTGITAFYVQNASGGGPQISSSLISDGIYELTIQYGSAYPVNNVDGKRIIISTDGTVPVGAFGFIEVEYSPVAADDLSQARVLMKSLNPPAYTITNGTVDRTYDANATTTDELADILYTLVQDLKQSGWIA